MASSIFSRHGNARAAARSFYEELRADDSEDPEALGDAESLQQHLDGLDLDEAEALIGDSRATLSSVFQGSKPDARAAQAIHPGQHASSTTRWPQRDPDADDDVPASLLVETHDPGEPAPRPSAKAQSAPRPPPPPSSRMQQGRVPSAVARGHQTRRNHRAGATAAGTATTAAGSPKEQALWRWANTTNMDVFMREVYDYFDGSGLWCILSARLLRLFESTFLAVFVTFLSQCINYGKLHGSHSLSQVVIPQCTAKMSALWSVGVWLYAFYFLWKCVQYALDVRRLLNMRDFFTHLLDIPEQDMQTVSWQDIIARIMALRDANPQTAINLPTRLRRFILGSQSKERLDAHDIANRLMRRENYLIAMINKDTLDFTLPVPFLRDRQFFSRTLEWWLHFSILDFVFYPHGQVNQEFLKSSRRGILSQKLRQRFIFSGILHLLVAPFAVAYLILIYVFTYYQEYQKNPSILGARRYSALAYWKFREFNELPHIFTERINMSYPFATRYVTQFPKQMTEQIARSVAFITGAMVAVLGALTLHDAEFLNFEITPDRTVLIYITILGGIWAAARGSISEETEVFNPEYALRQVIEYTRYLPDHWEGKLHSAEVLREFSEIYKLKWAVLLDELFGILTTPCVLLFSLPRCSDQIIDFFREFTIHVDGLGYVCSFAVFDFKRGAGHEPNNQGLEDVREDYYATKHGKMAASFYGFMDNYVVNPKTGIPGHMPPGHGQSQFHPPPSFPALNSPTLAGEMGGHRFGKGSIIDRDGSKMKGRGGLGRFGPVAQPSPMTSMLLDPHNQPSAEARSMHRPRPTRGFHGEESVIRESLERGASDVGGGSKSHESDDLYEPGGMLGESVWETSPANGLSREGSGAVDAEDSDTGVLGLIYQLQQTQRPQRNARAL